METSAVEYVAENNAMTILSHSTAYPFRQGGEMICCYFCSNRYDEPSMFRAHMDHQHENVKRSTLPLPKRSRSNLIRVDITNLRCKYCVNIFPKLDGLARHLNDEHDLKIKIDQGIGLVPLKLENRRFACLMCPKKFTGLTQLYKHAGTHFMSHICDICGKNLENRGSVENHKRQVHSSDQFFCSNCRKSFPSIQARREHRRIDKTCLPFKCNVCEERFRYWERREEHLTQVHGKPKKIFPCAECGTVFKKRNLLYFHFKAAHTDDNKCQYCERRYPTKLCLQEHTFRVHTEHDPLMEERKNAKIILKYSTAYPFRVPRNSMVCVYCCDSYEEPSTFRTHMQQEHDTFFVNSAYVHLYRNTECIKVDCTDLHCRICLEAFEIIDDVAKHLKETHHKKLNLDVGLGIQIFKLGQERWICATCDVKFPTLSALSRHANIHYHRYSCETCGKSYYNKFALNQHVMYSHINNSKICIKCKTSFPDTETRREHIVATTYCWPYSCSLCGQRFLTKRSRQDHLIKVHGEQPKLYSCPDCDSTYSTFRSHQAHFIISHTDRNHECPYCGLKFVTKRLYNNHVAVHTKEKIFKCTYCPM